jgi:hypothetical protein
MSYELRKQLEEFHARIAERDCDCAAELWELINREPSGYIIVGSERWPVYGAEVQTWLDTGLTFDHDHAPLRTQDCRLGVLHWTGGGKRVGLRGATKIHGTLQARGLSVETAVTDEGTIFQYVDPLVQRCRHASRVNPFAFGVEASGPGWIARSLLPTRYLGRERYRGTVHGWTTTFLDYFEDQHRGVLALANALVEPLGIPASVMAEPFERRRNRELRQFKGWCAHLHVAPFSVKHPKCDCGPRPILRLRSGFEGG